jgi:hypothetical protein
MKRLGCRLVLWLAVLCGIKGYGPTERTVAVFGQQAGNGNDPWSRFDMVGVDRCSKTACHGNNAAPTTKRKEYIIWITNDVKHAGASQALLSERSKIIERNLNSPGTDWQKAEPEKDTLCLKCHLAKSEPARRQRMTLDDGVSCENCHGPAEKWLEKHTDPSFHNLNPAAKLALGMVDLSANNLGGRIRVCVDCHVGNGTRGMEVNHDLIAAGHPRLAFEFSERMAVYVKHWTEQLDEERAWKLGQLVSAEAALQLVEFRADPRNKRPWPEYAEYDCFACHHDLVEPSWRQQQGYKNRRPGELPWGTWYFAQTEQLAAGLDKPLNALRREMAKPYPSRDTVKQSAETLAKALQQAANAPAGAPLGPQALRQSLNRIKGDFDKRNFANWDAAAQLYMRFDALNRALTNLEQQQDPKCEKALQEMVKTLEFPKSYNSPRDFRPNPGAK